MGKRSTKENKNAYQLCREELGLTRDKASELMQYISADRIEKIESEKTIPHPDEVLTMAKCYKKPALKNYYCSKVCSIGQQSVPELQEKDLSQIVLEILASLNTMEKQKNRLIDITVDGEITQDEIDDFVNIQHILDKISLTVDSLRMWVEESIANGKMDSKVLDDIKRTEAK